MKKISHLKTRRAEQGFSLVELMISITLGMALVLFVMSLYLNTKSSSRLQEDNARLQEDGRAAMSLIGKNIKQAWFGLPLGYFPGGVRTDFSGQGLTACDHGFQEHADISAPACSTENSGAPALQMSYRVADVADPNVGNGVDCNGQTAPLVDGKMTVINRFFLQKAKKEDIALTLYCVGNGNNNTPQPVLANVENIRYTYGVDTNADNTADTFVTSAATALAKTPQSPGFPRTGFPAFKGVVSVGVCLQMVSPNFVVQGEQTYIDCEGKSVTAKDRRLHLVMQNTYTVRNSSGTSLIN